MDINGFINIIIYSSNNEFSKYRYIFAGEKVRVILQTSDTIKIESYIKSYKKVIVMIDYELIYIDENNDKVFDCLRHNTIGGVVFYDKHIKDMSIFNYPYIEHVFTGSYSDFQDIILAIVKKIRIVNSKIASDKSVELVKKDKSIRNSSLKLINSNSASKKNLESKVYIKSSSNIVSNIEKNGPLKNNNEFDTCCKNNNISKIIVIGASTGGPDSILKILRKIPKDFKTPILIVQHMPLLFTKIFADRINNEISLTVIEAEDGNPVLGGNVYIAPGGKQMTVEGSNGKYFIKILPADDKNANNPSVDVLFNSVADSFGSKIVAVILTGMGKDGSKSLLRIKNQGGYTIAQDKNSSVVYGMPKVAYEMGAVEVQLDIDEMALKIIEAINKK